MYTIKLLSVAMEANPDDAPAQDPATEQGLAALQVVQTLVTESFKTAMASLSHELMEVVDRWIAAQLVPTSTPMASRASGESSIGVVNLKQREIASHGIGRCHKVWGILWQQPCDYC